MRKLVLLCLVVLSTMSLTCPALTIDQGFDGTSIPTGWTLARGGNALPTSTVSYPSGYLQSDIRRANTDQGAVSFSASLGSSSIVIPDSAHRVFAADMPEVWMSFDVAYLAGGSSSRILLVGVFNSEADSDYAPGLNFFGISLGAGKSTSALNMSISKCVGSGDSSNRYSDDTKVTTTGAVGDTYSVATHYYYDSSVNNYLGDITVTNLGTSTVQSLTRQVVLDNVWGFYVGINSFGIRNTMGGDTTNTYKIDNMHLQIPEPATIALLSLSMLFRRKTR